MSTRFSIFILLICRSLFSNYGCKQQESNSSAKPYVWWHWMGTNFSKEGITKDMEAMKESGIGGATIFNQAFCQIK